VLQLKLSQWCFVSFAEQHSLKSAQNGVIVSDGSCMVGHSEFHAIAPETAELLCMYLVVVDRVTTVLYRGMSGVCACVCRFKPPGQLSVGMTCKLHITFKPMVSRNC